MEFWGVEVKSGEALVVESGDGFILHLSQACLGEVKKDKVNESVRLSVKFGDKKFVLGTLSPEKFPQLAFDLVFEQEFELSHNWRHGSVYFSGYKVPQDQTDDDSEPEFEIKEDLPVATNNGKPGSEIKNTSPSVEKTKPESKQKVKIVEPTKNEKSNKDADDSSDDENDASDDFSDNDESSDDQHITANGEDDETDDDDDESDEDSESSDEDEAPKMVKTEQGKKRSAESVKKTPPPDKKAKLVTPQKTDGKKKVVSHVPTPHPSKQSGKTPATINQKKEQTQKPFTCAACNRSFGSENALQSHSKAKHSAA